MKQLRFSYLVAVLLCLLTYSTSQAATIVPAFGKWSSASGTVDAAKQNTNTMQVLGATLTKPGGKPTMTIGPASGIVDAGSAQTITGFKNFSSGLKAADVVAEGPIVDPRAYPYGVVLDGVTNDQAGMQALVNALGSDGKKHTINLFDKTLYLATPLQLLPGISIVNGTIKGSLYIGVDPTVGATATDFKNPHIENVNFVNTSPSNGAYAIKYSMARYAGFVRGCTFTNYDKAIWIPALNVEISGQFVHRLSISDNKYNNCNYFIRTEVAATSTLFGAADFHIDGNEGEVNITNLWLGGLDGANIGDNTFFQQGHPPIGHPEQGSTTKAYNVYLEKVNWIHLHNNNYFEAGLDAIHVKTFNNVTISGGSIAYPGERVPSSGIVMEGGVMGGMRGNNSTISGVTIQWPSKSGITLDGTISNVSITGNMIYGAGTAVDDGTSVYYGATDLSTIAHYAIDVNSAADFIHASGNVAPRNTYNFPTFNATDDFSNNIDLSGATRSPRLLSLTGTETTVDVTGINQLRLTQSAPSSLSLTGTIHDDDELLVIAYNGNTTLVDSATVHLKDRVNTTMPVGGNILLRWTFDCWREVSRNYDGSSNNSSLNLASGGTQITRNVGSGGIVLQISQLYSGSTEYLTSWYNVNTEVAHVDSSGNFISSGVMRPVTVTFSGLGSVPTGGTFKWCSNCTTAAICASGGSGHMAVSNGTNWTCQ